MYREKSIPYFKIISKYRLFSLLSEEQLDKNIFLLDYTIDLLITVLKLIIRLNLSINSDTM